MQPETAPYPTRFRFICRFDSVVALGCIGLGLLLSGCGNVLYTYRANSAATRIEEARQAGAEKSALYEYTLAREHLNKAMSEASEADYGDAAELAMLASDYAEKAVEKAKLRMRAPIADVPEVDTNPPSAKNAKDPQTESTTLTAPSSNETTEHP